MSDSDIKAGPVTDLNEAGPIRFVGDMTRLVVHPGDKFVLSLSFEPTNSFVSKFYESWHYMHDGSPPPLIILTPGMTLGVVGEEIAAKPATSEPA